VVRSGIFDILAYGSAAGDLLIFELVGFDQNLRPKADGGDEFTLGDRMGHQMHHIRISADAAAGNHQGIKIFGHNFRRRCVRFDRNGPPITLVGIIHPGPQDDDPGSRLAQSILGNLKLQILKLVFN
jgi:hypothetical protein